MYKTRLVVAGLPRTVSVVVAVPRPLVAMVYDPEPPVAFPLTTPASSKSALKLLSVPVPASVPGG